MPIEYEYRYREQVYNKGDIIQRIQSIGGTKKGSYLFRVCVFEHPLKKSCYIRVRDEGYRKTLTFKTKTHSTDEFPQENEIIINDFDQGYAILEGLGCVKKYCYEKIREIWYIDDTSTEICWDTNPGRYDLMEIESETEKELLKTVKLLEMEGVAHDDFTDDGLYMDQFDIDLNRKTSDLTFNSAYEILTPLCGKNHKEFKQLIDRQFNQYTELLGIKNETESHTGGSKKKLGKKNKQKSKQKSKRKSKHKSKKIKKKL